MWAERRQVAIEQTTLAKHLLRALSTAFLLLCAAGQSRSAQAQATGSSIHELAGRWRAGTTTMDVRVESWGADCGPRPQSSRASGGGTVRVTLEGPELLIHGQGRQVRTDACWSRNPAMRRSSSRFLAGKWTTHCRTPSSDPRAESGTYSITRVSDNELRYVDISQYDWKLKESACTATITTVQTLHRHKPRQAAVASTDETQRAASTENPGDQAPPAWEPNLRIEPDQQAAERVSHNSRSGCTPGKPARISMNPTEAELELGQEMCVLTRVVDAKGCPLPTDVVEYHLEHSRALRAELNKNCFRASERAAEGEGEYVLIARAGEVEARTRFLVAATDLSSLIAKRLEVGAVTGFDDLHASSATPTPPPPATRISAHEAATAKPRRPSYAIMLALAGGLAVLFGIGLVLWRQRQSVTGDPEITNAPSAPEPSAEHSGQPASSALDKPPALRNQEEAYAATHAGGAAATWICPNCRHGFAPEHEHCPNCAPAMHRLLPYAEFTERHRQQEGLKRCAECGQELPGSSNFCGNCGSQRLQPQNP